MLPEVDARKVSHASGACGSTGTTGGWATATGGAVGAVSDLPEGQITGEAGNMPPYKVVNRWHRTA